MEVKKLEKMDRVFPYLNDYRAHVAMHGMYAVIRRCRVGGRGDSENLSLSKSSKILNLNLKALNFQFFLLKSSKSLKFLVDKSFKF